MVVIVIFRQRTTQRGDGGAHHVHRVGAGGQFLEHVQHRVRHAAQGFQPGFVSDQLGLIRQGAVDEEVGDFLELTGLGDIEDVVAAIMQVVSGAADRAEGGVAGGDAGQSH